ncbi:MAG: type II toxin-antitoxin system VapC family toxin [Cyanobacteriota bacterium]|nr:type II toxin-antitoxin system VapC family toxin [Cyanobacteriota bacterium]
MTVVLDASALLAYLKDEPGSDLVDGVLDDLQVLGLRIEPFTSEDGEMAGRLWEQTRQAGLSLGDRACLSLGLRLGVSVLTSDHAWATLNLSVNVEVIR